MAGCVIFSLAYAPGVLVVGISIVTGATRIRGQSGRMADSAVAASPAMVNGETVREVERRR